MKRWHLCGYPNDKQDSWVTVEGERETSRSQGPVLRAAQIVSKLFTLNPVPKHLHTHQVPEVMRKV